MLIKVIALEVWFKNELLEVHPVKDMYDELVITYPTKCFTLDELKEALKSHGEKSKRFYYGAYVAGDDHLTFNSEAKDLPSIGELRVVLTEQTLTWNKIIPVWSR